MPYEHTVDELLREAGRRRASDLHLTVGRPPVVRVDGVLMTLKGTPLAPSDTEDLARQILRRDEAWSRFLQAGEVDAPHSIKGEGRYRVNIYRQRSAVAVAIRLIPAKVPTLEELGLPPILRDLALREDGMIIVTGPTGSGKSTTLAAMIDCINRNRQCHIITLEDPVEYLLSHGTCIINQREIGNDSKSFAAALRSALRQDPDVILLGEMRDQESMTIALQAAETGHLVLTTLHTSSASQTVERLVDSFPAHQQDQVRVQLASVLQGIVAQRLLPRAGSGRVAALEVLTATAAVRNLVREGKTHQLPSVIQTGARFGMVSKEAYLKELRRKDQISDETFRRETDMIHQANGRQEGASYG